MATKVPFERFKAALQRYVFEQIVPKVGDVGSQFMLGAAYGLMESKLKGKLSDAGIESNGEVDIDCLDTAIKHGFKASNDKASFSILGQKLTFSPDDWATFKRQL